METKGTKLPDQVQVNYGNDRYEQGYRDGYFRSTLDARKRRFLREKAIRKLSDDFIDYLDDAVASHKK